MCYVCCREFKGWCRSFTRTEALLCVLEGVLIFVFLSFLLFLVLHFLSCSTHMFYHTNSTCIEEEQNNSEGTSTYALYPSGSVLNVTTYKVTISTKYGTNIKDRTNVHSNTRITLSPDVSCSWTPSKKTEATTHHYELDKFTKQVSQEITTIQEIHKISLVEASHDILIGVEESDGEEAEPLYNKFILALVKLRPPQDVVFGCILTILSEYWTLTAASCIESIEEVDSLDSFVIMENYGGPVDGVTHALADIQIHPFYQGKNRSYDMVALKSDDSLVKRNCNPVALPQLIDYSLLTPGERLTILGYSKFRTVNHKGAESSLRAVHVYIVPAYVCEARAADAWAPRHLWGGRGVGRAGSGACSGAGSGAELCAGVLYARGVSCNYCAGTPLLADAGVLLGVMAADDQCGVACEPALYVNIANARQWIDYVLDSD